MDGTVFLKRADGVAFWVMMLLSLILLAYSYAVTQVIDWLLVSVIVVNCFILRFTHMVAFIRRKPWIMEIEKSERIAFWGMSLTLLVALILTYAETNLFNYNVFLVLFFGLFTKIVVSALRS
jgi:phosphatidylglycerophosphate synthase